jgi:hypothetical protein
VTIIQKLIAGSDLRRSRLHDGKGQFALRSTRDLIDCLSSATTAGLRLTTGILIQKPWITANSFRHIRRTLGPDAKVFEWGAGMSTLWFENNVGEVHAVEHDPDWFDLLRRQVRSARLYNLHGDAYVRKICDFPENYFDLISVDGLYRLDCYSLAERWLAPGGTLLIDNTDKHRTTDPDVYQLDGILEGLTGFHVKRFVGWAPGALFAQETTLCTRKRPSPPKASC